MSFHFVRGNVNLTALCRNEAWRFAEGPAPSKCSDSSHKKGGYQYRCQGGGNPSPWAAKSRAESSNLGRDSVEKAWLPRLRPSAFAAFKRRSEKIQPKSSESSGYLGKPGGKVKLNYGIPCIFLKMEVPFWQIGISCFFLLLALGFLKTKGNSPCPLSKLAEPVWL